MAATGGMLLSCCARPPTHPPTKFDTYTVPALAATNGLPPTHAPIAHTISALAVTPGSPPTHPPTPTHPRSLCPCSYPWFATYNYLNEKLPPAPVFYHKLLRAALIGFCASAVSGEPSLVGFWWGLAWHGMVS